MNELYWIGRCAVVNEIAAIVLIAGLVVAGILGFIIICAFIEGVFDTEDWVNVRRWSKKIAVVCAISTVFYAFVPSQKEMYLILGIGGTIDYLQSNEKAGQIPDKCLDAIDAWVDSLVEDEKSKE